jgi:uncharacterized protein (DUF1697 family)
MKTFIVLLRGINVGGKNLLPMRKLVGSLEALGLENVSTYIQSGNVVSGVERMPSQIPKLSIFSSWLRARRTRI